jgi:lipopolysaccharide heptosyltransferase I
MIPTERRAPARESAPADAGRLAPDARRILVVRLGAMGDIVHALPLLASLRGRWPGARVDWLVDRRHLAILDLVPGVAEVITIDTRRFTGDAGWPGVVRRLRRARYDVVIDAQGLIKSALLARLSGAPVVVGFSSAHARERLAGWLYSVAVRPDAPHVVDRGLALAVAAGVTRPVRQFDLTVPDPSPAILQILAMLDRFVVLNPGAAWPNKRWPADRFGAVAARLHELRGLRSLVTWGPGEEALALDVVARADAAAILAPATSLADLVGLLARASLVISGDTGPLHLAAALGTPTVGIFGPTDPWRNGPWAPSDEALSRHDRCTCSHKRRCTASRWCLSDLAVTEVAQAAERRLTAAAAERSG